MSWLYGSSVFLISGRRYGWPGFSRDICRVDVRGGQSIIEVPMSTVEIFGKTIPAAGGGYNKTLSLTYLPAGLLQKSKNKDLL
jgi:hypothetical protein